MPSAEQLQVELNGIVSVWKSIQTEFFGPTPCDCSTNAEWSQATELELIQVQGDNPALSFAQAWHSTVSRLRELFWGRLQPWAASLLSQYGIPTDVRSIPDPPCDHIPDGTGRLYDATGTADLVEAGIRVIFWCAADLSPTSFQRSPELSVFFHRWAGRILEFTDSSIRPSSCVLLAVTTAFEQLVRNRCQAPCSAATSRPLSDANVPKIIHIGGMTYTLLFDEAQVLIHNQSAVRLVQILRNERVSVADLLGKRTRIAKPSRTGTKQIQSNRSRQPQSEKRTSEYMRNPEQARKVAQALRAEIKKDELALGTVSDPKCREEIQLRIKICRKELNSLRRIDKSQDEKDRENLRKGFDRLFSAIETRELSKRIATHLRKNIMLSPDGSFYMYIGGQTWIFEEMPSGQPLS